jgi:hypothetical protein
VAKRPCPPERWRRLRLADLRALFLWRHRGKILSNDDTGIEDLEELLYPISLGRRPKEAMRFEISERAPWVPETEIEPFIARILNLPRNIRMPKARTLGKRLRVTNEECQRLGISSTIKPFDMTDEDLAEQPKRVQFWLSGHWNSSFPMPNLQTKFSLGWGNTRVRPLMEMSDQ